ncbi:MAG TPA: F0F1 ATP synthase subunit B [Phycisphaerae bacterium]|jgi:F-type H+-transporting ATPase subunit b
MRQKNLAMFCLALALLAGTAASCVRAAAPASAPVKAEMAEGEKKDLVTEETKPGPLVVSILIFICLFLVLRKLAWKPISQGLKDRENAIRDSIEAARKAKEEAERTTKELEARMAEAQRASAAQLQQAKADAQKIADTIRAQAEAESAALKDRTLREIDAAKQQAVTEINTHAAVLGTAVARKILQRNVTADDQQRLVEESLSEMAKKN